MAGNADGLARIATEIGFVAANTKASHRTAVIGLIQMTFDALKAKPQFDFASTVLSRKMQAEGMALADDGFLPPLLPMDILLLQRKFGGVFLLAARLGAKVDMAALLAPYLDQTAN